MHNHISSQLLSKLCKHPLHCMLIMYTHKVLEKLTDHNMFYAIVGTVRFTSCPFIVQALSATKMRKGRSMKMMQKTTLAEQTEGETCNPSGPGSQHLQCCVSHVKHANSMSKALVLHKRKQGGEDRILQRVV